MTFDRHSVHALRAPEQTAKQPIAPDRKMSFDF